MTAEQLLISKGRIIVNTITGLPYLRIYSTKCTVVEGDVLTCHFGGTYSRKSQRWTAAGKQDLGRVGSYLSQLPGVLHDIGELLVWQSRSSYGSFSLAAEVFTIKVGTALPLKDLLICPHVE